MTTKQSSVLTNADAEPQVLNRSSEDGAKLRVKTGTLELATGDLDAADTVELVDLPTNAVVHSIQIANDDLDSDGSPTLVMDVGLYDITDAGALGAAKDDNVYASASTQLQAAAGFTELAFSARNIDEAAQQVFEDAGDTTDPAGVFRLVLTFDTGAATAAAGTLSYRVEYSVEA